MKRRNHVSGRWWPTYNSNKGERKDNEIKNNKKWSHSVFIAAAAAAAAAAAG